MAKKGRLYQTHQVRNLKKSVSVIDYCREAFPILGSRTAVQKAITNDRLFLNGKKAEAKAMVKNGDFLKLKGAGVSKAKAFDADLEIVYEDDAIIVINKPAGIAVNGNRNKTVENALAGVANRSVQADALPRPVAVHRIDVPTKGLVLLAKTKAALIQLGKAFQQNLVKKEYVAVVHGRPAPKARIDLPIKGKNAVTDYQTLQVAPSKVFTHLALVRLQPVTGRTHQLRIHLKEQGHPIVGDKMYAGKQKTILGKGLFLCACRLQFKHPQTKEWMDLNTDVPPKFIKLLQREGERS